MSGIERVIDGVREVLRMSDEIKRLSEGLKMLAVEVREMDRRLIRIETLVEFSKKHSDVSIPPQIES